MRRALLVVLLACACGDGLGPPRVRPAPAPDAVAPLRGDPTPRSPRLASYQIDARLDVAAHRIEATQVLTWRNGGGQAVTTLPLHLYLNGFANETTLFMQSSGGAHRGHAATDGAWGWIDVTSIREVGADAELRPSARFVGPDQTVLELPLPRPVGPGEQIELAMAFTAQLPAVFARTGYAGAFTMVAQWFPKVGVLRGAPGLEAWVCEPFHALAEFFADFGTYDVALTVPQTHVVAATGVLTATEDHADGTRTLRYRAEDVHDFAWMADPYMEVMSQAATTASGPVEVRVYHRPAQRAFARRHLAAGVGAIEQFSAHFGDYPWAVMTIVDPPLEAAGAAGMEYPTLVTTAGDTALARPGLRLPEYVTVHEIGHQWFGGMLASDEGAEPWLDEGVNEWADALVMGALYGERASAVDWLGWSAELASLRRAVADDPASLPTPIATAAAAFVDGDAYAEVAYGKALLALRTLEYVLGRPAMVAAMGAYARAWRFRHPTGADLFAALEEHTGADLGWLIGPAFHQLGAVELAIRSSSCVPSHPPRGRFVDGDGSARVVTAADAPSRGAWRCEVIVANTGTVPVPVELELRFTDGTVRRERWDGRGPWHRLVFDRASPLAEVVLDPERRILLQDDLLALRERARADLRASYRAGARLGFWAQAAMIGAGL
ncbi:MAG: M1 family metallopeptidase [Kofleriaceae bacterium]